MKFCQFLIILSCLFVSSCVSSHQMSKLIADGIANDRILIADQNRQVTPLYSKQYSRNDSLEFIKVFGNISIPERCFEICENLQDVLLEDTVKRIESNAFFSCRKLKRINLDWVNFIGRNAFKFTLIDTINLRSVITVEDFAFSQCPRLQEILFSDSLQRIGDFAFASNPSISELHLPSASIGDNSFMQCNNLVNVWLEYNIEKPLHLGSSVFLGCKSLKKVSLPEGLTTIPDYIFSGCSSLDSIALPSTLDVIGRSAFENTSIKYLSIPSNVSRIEHNAFANCTQLRIVYVNNKDIIMADDSFPEETSIIFNLVQ